MRSSKGEKMLLFQCVFCRERFLYNECLLTTLGMCAECSKDFDWIKVEEITDEDDPQ